MGKRKGKKKDNIQKPSHVVLPFDSFDETGHSILDHFRESDASSQELCIQYLLQSIKQAEEPDNFAQLFRATVSRLRLEEYWRTTRTTAPQRVNTFALCAIDSIIWMAIKPLIFTPFNTY